MHLTFSIFLNTRQKIVKVTLSSHHPHTPLTSHFMNMHIHGHALLPAIVKYLCMLLGSIYSKWNKAKNWIYTHNNQVLFCKFWPLVIFSISMVLLPFMFLVVININSLYLLNLVKILQSNLKSIKCDF